VDEGTVFICGTLRGEAEEIVEHGEWGMMECRVAVSTVNLHAFSNCISCI
jgi:hypothetical protein